MSYLSSSLFLWLTMVTVLVSEPLNELTSILGEDPAERYNKTLASKSSTVQEEPGTRAPLIILPNLPTTPKSTKPDSIDGILYFANRGKFSTPAVPKDQFTYPFADKNTLRGSNSETAIVNRLPPRAPITATRNVSTKRIPIKRPDLISPSDSRKSINTASVRKLADPPNHSLANEKVVGTSTLTTNNTLGIVAPAVNLSPKNVLRILENGNSKNEFIENSKPRSEHDFKVAKSHFGVPTSKPLSSTVVVRSVYEEEKQPSIRADFNVTEANKYGDILAPVTETKNGYVIDESTNVRMPRYPDRRVRYVVGSSAWNIHVYSAATLFTILAVTSAYTLSRVNATKWMLPSWYFFAIHSLLTVIGSVRSIYFFYDAYNVDQSFAEPVSRLLINLTFPLLVCLFLLMFLFVLKIVDLNTDLHYADKSSGFVLSLVVIYTVVAVCVDVCADFTAYAATLTRCSQFLFIVLCTALGSAFILFYKYVSRSALYKPSAVYGSTFTDMLKPCLAHTMRVMLAVSLLSLLMAAVQLIGIICVRDALNNGQPHHPWLWWAFQLSVRVIEASICYLIFWAASQSQEEGEGEDDDDDEKKEIQSHSASGFPLFASNSPKMNDSAAKEDDIYSSICSVNEASSRRGATQIYEDVFQYCHPAVSAAPAPTVLSRRPIGSATLNYATDRRSLRRLQTRVDIDPVRTMCGTLRRGCPERRFVDVMNGCVVDTHVYLEEPRASGFDSRHSTNSNCSRANGLYNVYRPFL